MTEFSTLTEAASAWLASGLRPAETHSQETGNSLGTVSVKFTWNGQDYEVSVRKLPADHFSVGEAVRLKTGGPEMTIVAVLPFATGTGIRAYQCAWSEGGKQKKESFSYESLKRIVQ